MHAEWLSDRLRALDPEDENGLEALTAEVSTADRRDARDAARLWTEPDAALSRKAMILLSGLEDLAVIPLLELETPHPPEKESWLLATITEAQIQLRNQVAGRIDLSLADKRPIPRPPGAMEREPEPRRVCDEAYLLMRRLTHPTESEEQYQTQVRNFLELGDRQKDREITKARQSVVWRRLTAAD